MNEDNGEKPSEDNRSGETPLKTCAKCQTPKLLTEFHHRRSRHKNELLSYCKACRERPTTWDSPRAIRQKEVQIKFNYQLSREDWEKIYQYQKGLCSVCKKPIGNFLGEGGPKAAVDHCHKTGLVRGLLHRWPCNRIIGHFRDDPVMCRAVADYLEHPPAPDALGAPRFAAPGRVGTKKRRRLIKKIVQRRLDNRCKQE